jgi:hypothetical protein
MVCPVLDGEQQFQGSVLIHEDITQAREAQNQLSFLAERDPAHRPLQPPPLRARARRAARSGRPLAGARRPLLLRPRRVQERERPLRHRMGDQVLLQVAGEIRAQLRRSEFFARIGGDEFALVVTDADDDQIRRSPSA